MDTDNRQCGSSQLGIRSSPCAFGVVLTGAGCYSTGIRPVAFDRSEAHRKEVFFFIHRLSTGQPVEIPTYSKSIVDRLVARSVQ